MLVPLSSAILQRAKGRTNMTNAFSYACRDCDGMEACPSSLVAETKVKIWKLMELHALAAHGENPADWDRETREYLGTLIKPVTV